MSKILRYIIYIGILLILWSLIERKWIKVTRYEVKTNQMRSLVAPLKLIVLADLHDCKFGYRNEKLIKKIEKINPDLILMAGDMITKQVPAMNSNAFYLLETLVKKYNIYYGYGNHEQGVEGRWKIEKDNIEQEEILFHSWLEYKKKLTELGVIFLNNQGTNVKVQGESITISGVSIGAEFFRKKNIPPMRKGYLTEKLGDNQGEGFQILFGHNPVYFDEYVEWGADLTFAGHIHGGMVRLPGLGGVISPQVKFFPKYDWGKFEQDGSTMIVSRGLGSHSIMPRLFNPPELVFVEVTGINEGII